MVALSQHEEVDHGPRQAACILWGVVLAIVLFNWRGGLYHDLVEGTWFVLPGWLHGHHVTLHFAITELGMAFFFVNAGAEVRESFLPNGALSNPRHAALPLVATLGGVAGPAIVYAVLSGLFDSSLRSGWVIPTATDIAFASVLAKLIFKKGHPAVNFLLTLAVVDDGIGLALIPTVYADGVKWHYLLAVILAMVGGTWILRQLGRRKWWEYLVFIGLPGWVGFVWLEVHPAMAFVPMVVLMPHEHTDKGMYAEEELKLRDTLNCMKAAITPWMAPLLFGFGLTNAGISVTNFGNATWIVTLSLLVGKLVGIVCFSIVGMRVLRLALPDGMSKADLWVMAAIASIGFTVALFVANVAFEGDLAQQAGLGAALTLFTGCIAAFILKFAFGRFGESADKHFGADDFELAQA